MQKEIKNIKCKKGDIRNFGITIGLILITIAVLLLWKEKHSYEIFIVVGTLLCLIGFILPIILKPFFYCMDDFCNNTRLVYDKINFSFGFLWNNDSNRSIIENIR